jgi:hypothetical protein
MLMCVVTPRTSRYIIEHKPIYYWLLGVTPFEFTEILLIASTIGAGFPLRCGSLESIISSCPRFKRRNNTTRMRIGIKSPIIFKIWQRGGSETFFFFFLMKNTGFQNSPNQSTKPLFFSVQEKRTQRSTVYPTTGK